MSDRLQITRPDDWHLHLRDGQALRFVVPATASVFGRAIAMPNLKPPVTTVAEASAYRERILAARPPGSRFEPLMTLYLTPSTSPGEVEAAVGSPFVHAIKLYPAGATTNAEHGVADLSGLGEVFETMAARGLPLLVHGESIDPDVDVFDREAVFIEQTLAPLLERHPNLRVVFEHITTAEAVAFVRAAGANVAATITAHHLLLNRNDIFAGGISPHHYCLPVLKRERHREALVEAACSGEPKFFLGTDSAPHGRRTKEAACGCAGIYTAPLALPLYAEAFDAVGALDRLQGFASHFGADFYGLPRNGDTIVLQRDAVEVPATLPYVDDVLVPMRAGRTVAWRVASA